MKIYAVLVLIGLLALQLAPGVNLVARAQQSGNTDGTGNNATLDITYPPQVTTGPKQLCHSENGVRSSVVNLVLFTLTGYWKPHIGY